MILDASAVMAFVLQAPGQEVVAEALVAGAEMTTVNLAEVLTRYVLHGAPDKAEIIRRELPVTIVPVDEDLAYRAALMASQTRQAGLSLGDHLCLALAQRTGDTVLTADRAWRDIAAAINVKVTLIR
ncbi:MAG: type II toxin-antitoxin system VapC family toxin [Acetobacteraceae bacterium]|nr:type II toxin-antitoxin system VapC family toxin [Pseudomonadota bacterium]